MFSKTQAMIISYIAISTGWLYGNLFLVAAGLFVLITESLTDTEDEQD